MWEVMLRSKRGSRKYRRKDGQVSSVAPGLQMLSERLVGHTLEFSHSGG